jgi:PAS domain S-box-containing protein
LLRFSNVIHNTINPIQISDAQGTMVYVNPAFEKVTGYSNKELIGKNPNILNSRKHSKEFWFSVWKHIISGKVWVGRIENRRKDGSPFFTELVISPIVDSRGNIVGYLGAHRDITEQIILEQQLVRSQRMESIGTLAAGIAHEVGNPLTAISSLVQVIQRTSTDEFAKEKLELINSQVNRITRIIRELVDFSRPSLHVVKPTNINRIVKEALNIVQYGKKVKDITFTLDLDEHLPEIAAVPDQIVQVFINILMNAVDSLDERRGTITVQSRKNEHAVEVMVHDTGKGIEPSALEKIFEPFYTTKTTGQGTGLGLWVSYGIVKSFGGDVFVESIPGKGSTFTVSFPMKGV